ncbi:MAG: hypothetical protein CL388_01115 [Acidiferrobacteraceae bacterium]|jgi:hypothetical protein|nr:hypothetical protein [Acidiferrobacteraceae bacterium]MDP6122610.1 hypothetical protein [Arenicellales bacterium]MBT58857.1 hypothetical protein [Acidiferrobacteraceae bacterium]MDP6434798.1 hypothetical protein [Arenicellales bacterium]MDP6672963.1 hypothetical protein [Arenicellales bacterium]|tara:strand:+ start:584 stop:820 length:237 start_codon:yes stop_codon:yes gene_type:complete
MVDISVITLLVLVTLVLALILIGRQINHSLMQIADELNRMRTHSGDETTQTLRDQISPVEDEERAEDGALFERTLPRL